MAVGPVLRGERARREDILGPIAKDSGRNAKRPPLKPQVLAPSADLKGGAGAERVDPRAAVAAPSRAQRRSFASHVAMADQNAHLACTGCKFPPMAKNTCARPSAIARMAVTVSKP